MSRDTDSRWMSGPPEPTCARCGAYIHDEDIDEDGNWKCHGCGWDGEPDCCVVCKAHIGPKDENFGCSICKTCETGEPSGDEQTEEWHEYLMRTYSQEDAGQNESG